MCGDGGGRAWRSVRTRIKGVGGWFCLFFVSSGMGGKVHSALSIACGTQHSVGKVVFSLASYSIFLIQLLWFCKILVSALPFELPASSTCCLLLGDLFPDLYAD